MLDLGTSFVASVARDPTAVAIVDADLRLTYAQWFARISSIVAAFDDIVVCVLRGANERSKTSPLCALNNMFQHIDSAEFKKAFPRQACGTDSNCDHCPGMTPGWIHQFLPILSMSCARTSIFFLATSKSL